eukprot:Partr_v1_DN28680_c0_g1_i1_m50097 putative SEC24 family, member
MLDSFPCGPDGDEEVVETKCRIGIMTFDRILHFYNLNSRLEAPQAMAVSDIDDVFVPLEEGLLVSPVESRHVIEQLLDSLPNMYAQARTAEVCFGAAVRGALDALKRFGGRLVVLNTAIPSAGPGVLKPRDDAKLLGTDNERQLFTPQNNFYQRLGEECAEAGVGVDLFLLPQNYVDVASIGLLSSLTGGNTYLYPNFRADVDGIKFARDLQRLLIRPFGYDALLRVRVGNGLRVHEHFGNFYMKNSTDVVLAVVDSEKALGIMFKHDDVLDERREISFQVALLYTSSDGRRLIRCLNLSIPCTSQIPSMFRKADMDTTMNILTKQAI